jgi:hypothetical protein
LVKYIRSFELFQKSARIGFTQGFHEGRWNGLLNGVHKSIKRSGLSDSRLRFAINVCGAPPLEGKDFADYRAKVDVETIVGMALVVHLPTGDYMDDKLISFIPLVLVFGQQQVLAMAMAGSPPSMEKRRTT